jgi:hypothetical protein
VRPVACSTYWRARLDHLRSAQSAPHLHRPAVARELPTETASIIFAACWTARQWMPSSSATIKMALTPVSAKTSASKATGAASSLAWSMAGPMSSAARAYDAATCIFCMNRRASSGFIPLV